MEIMRIVKYTDKIRIGNTHENCEELVLFLQTKGFKNVAVNNSDKTLINDNWNAHDNSQIWNMYQFHLDENSTH